MLVNRLTGVARIVALSAALAVPALAGASVQALAAPAPQALANFWALPGYYAQPETVMNLNPVIAQAWGLRNPVSPMPAMASNGTDAR